MKLETLPSLISEKFDNEILFVPKKIQIVDGGLTVHWEKCLIELNSNSGGKWTKSTRILVEITRILIDIILKIRILDFRNITSTRIPIISIKIISIKINLIRKF